MACSGLIGGDLCFGLEAALEVFVDEEEVRALGLVGTGPGGVVFSLGGSGIKVTDV